MHRLNGCQGECIAMIEILVVAALMQRDRCSRLSALCCPLFFLSPTQSLPSIHTFIQATPHQDSHIHSLDKEHDCFTSILSRHVYFVYAPEAIINPVLGRLTRMT